MCNWKKEGYEVGKEVCIVNNFGIYNQSSKIIEGKIVYVGTKRLKVAIPFGDKEKILDFNGKRSVSGLLFGDYYFVYKDKEEYDKVIKEKEDIENARKYIKDNLNKLSLEKLNDIISIID